MAIHIVIKSWEFIDETLQQFRGCFSRKRTFSWFMVIIAGLMVRSDHAGLTSIVRELLLDPNKYTSLDHFFHSDAWLLETIKQKWLEIVKSSGLVSHIHGKIVLIEHCSVRRNNPNLPTSFASDLM